MRRGCRPPAAPAARRRESSRSFSRRARPSSPSVVRPGGRVDPPPLGQLGPQAGVRLAQRSAAARPPRPRRSGDVQRPQLDPPRAASAAAAASSSRKNSSGASASRCSARRCSALSRRVLKSRRGLLQHRLRILDHEQRPRRQVLERRRHLRVERRRQRLDAEEVLARLDLLQQVAGLAATAARRRRPPPGCGPADRPPSVRMVSRTGWMCARVQRAQRALAGGIEQPHRLQLVAEQLQPQRMAVDRREQIQHRPPHREGARDPPPPAPARSRPRPAAAISASRSTGSPGRTWKHSGSKAARGITRGTAPAAEATSTRGARPASQPVQHRHPPHAACAGRAASRRRASSRPPAQLRPPPAPADRPRPAAPAGRSRGRPRAASAALSSATRYTTGALPLAAAQMGGQRRPQRSLGPDHPPDRWPGPPTSASSCGQGLAQTPALPLIGGTGRAAGFRARTRPRRSSRRSPPSPMTGTRRA